MTEEDDTEQVDEYEEISLDTGNFEELVVLLLEELRNEMEKTRDELEKLNRDVQWLKLEVEDLKDNEED